MPIAADSATLNPYQNLVALATDDTGVFRNAVGYLYLTRADAEADNPNARVTVYTPGGAEVANLVSNAAGVIEDFLAEPVSGWVNFGAGPQQVFSGQGILDLITDTQASNAGLQIAVGLLQQAVQNGPGPGTGSGLLWVQRGSTIPPGTPPQVLLQWKDNA